MSHAQSLRTLHHLRLRLDGAKTIWHGALGNIFSSYRPKLHYMRESQKCGLLCRSQYFVTWFPPGA